MGRGSGRDGGVKVVVVDSGVSGDLASYSRWGGRWRRGECGEEGAPRGGFCVGRRVAAPRLWSRRRRRFGLGRWVAAAAWGWWPRRLRGDGGRGVGYLRERESGF